MVTRYGMEEGLGHAAYDLDQSNLLGLPDERQLNGPRPSERTAELIDKAVAAILDRCFDTATQILTEIRAVLDHAAEELLKRETLDEASLIELTQAVGKSLTKDANVSTVSVD